MNATNVTNLLKLKELSSFFFIIFLVRIRQGVLDRLVEHFVEFASEPVIVRAALLLNLGGIERRDEMSEQLRNWILDDTCELIISLKSKQKPYVYAIRKKNIEEL